jgi:acyl-coenzyme A thioesterase PaaI-like protein
MKINELLERASKSAFSLWLLNFVLLRNIPFNKPHQLKILSIAKNKVVIRYPYIKSNLNHLKGLHACGLATVSEYSTGILLLNHLDPEKYRLIMKWLHMDYHYQGKKSATATFELENEWIETNVIKPLKTNDVVFVDCEVKVLDEDGNHISTCKTQWQIKSWDKTKVKI